MGSAPRRRREHRRVARGRNPRPPPLCAPVHAGRRGPRAGARPAAVPPDRRTGGRVRAGPPPSPPGVTGALTGALDRAGLRRFSTGRYLVIWGRVHHPLPAGILFLIYSDQGTPAALPKYMMVETQ